MTELAYKLDDNYIEGQLSLDEYMQNNSVVDDSVKEVQADRVIEKIHIPRSGVTDDDKRRKIEFNDCDVEKW